MAKISLRHLVKMYPNGKCAVDDFNLEIADRQFLVLVGPSGCGKTTLLRLIAGLEIPSDGEIYFDGVCQNEVEVKDRNVAMVFQNFSLYPHLSVFENIAFGLRLQKMPLDELERRVNAAAEAVGLTDCLTRKPRTLSGGQCQRVALARAMVRMPEVYLMDEPLSNVDAELRKQLQQELKQLHSKLSQTLVYVTHDQSEAMALADKIVVMDGGKIQQVDVPSALINFPYNTFVATFFGTPQMNIIPCTVKQSQPLTLFWHKDIVLDNNRSVHCNTNLPQNVLLGIRPEDVKLAQVGVPAVVERLETIGEKQWIYLSVEDVNLVAEVEQYQNVQVGQNVFFQLNTTNACLFNVHGHSLLGVPNTNVLPCNLQGSNIILGGAVLRNPIANRLLPFAEERCTSMFVDTQKVSVRPMEGIALPLNVHNVVAYCDGEDAIYANVEGTNFPFAFRVSRGSVLCGKLTVYLPGNGISFADEFGNKVRCVEEVLPNVAHCALKTKGDVSVVKVGKTKLHFSNLHLPDGKYNLEILSDKVDVKLGKKSRKECGVIAKAYGENHLGNSTAVFAQVDGWQNYVTVVHNNAFSVYEHPIFRVILTEKSIKLTPKDA